MNLHNTRIYTLLSLVLTLGLSTAHAGFDSSLEAVKRDAMKKNIIELTGVLTCSVTAENDGRACDLKLKESESGKVFNLTHANVAMRLYQDGSPNVSIGGELQGENTIAVSTARAL